MHSFSQAAILKYSNWELGTTEVYDLTVRELCQDQEARSQQGHAPSGRSKEPRTPGGSWHFLAGGSTAPNSASVFSRPSPRASALPFSSLTIPMYCSEGPPTQDDLISRALTSLHLQSPSFQIRSQSQVGCHGCCRPRAPVRTQARMPPAAGASPGGALSQRELLHQRSCPLSQGSPMSQLKMNLKGSPSPELPRGQAEVRAASA